MVRAQVSTLVAVLDIGGTKTAAALVDSDGRVVDRAQAATPGADGPDAVLEVAVSLVRSLMTARAARSTLALGVGSAGVVDPVTGVILSATDVLASWAGTDVRGRLAAAFEVPTVVRNDVHAHALGEAAYGAAAGRTSLLHVAVGTGVGSAFVHTGLPGGLLTGTHAAAGHAGHVPSPQAGDLPCPCGARGHLEAVAAGPAIVREHRRRTGSQARDLRDVAALAAAGDADATDVIRASGVAVGAAIGGLVNVLDPDVVVVGGGVAALGALWWGPLREAAAREVLPVLAETPVQASRLGQDAALLGAAALAWDLVGGQYPTRAEAQR